METLLTKAQKKFTTTWDGKGWNNGKPTPYANAVINWPYNTAIDGNFSCKNINLATNTASLTINNGGRVQVYGTEFLQTAGATVTVNDGGELVLFNPAIDATAVKLTINRNIPNVQLSDYWFLGAPISGKTLAKFCPTTDTGRFYQYATTGFATLPPATTNTVAGRGYMIRCPANHAVTPTTWAVTINNTDGVGTLNTGIIKLSLKNALAVFVHLSNPYPARLNFRRFYEKNKQWIKSVLLVYFYTNASGGDSYTRINTICSNKAFFTPYILPFQSFLVELYNVADTNSIVFTPDMMVLDTDFSTPDRFYLTLLKDGINRPFSGVVWDADNFPKNFTNFGIAQGLSFGEGTFPSILKGTLQSGMELPLYIKTGAAGNYSVVLDRTDGLLNDMNIYLVDGGDVMYDLKHAPFVFTTTAANVIINKYKIKII